METDIELKKLKFYAAEENPKKGKVFTVTHSKHFNNAKAGTVLDLSFRMEYKGNTVPTAKIISFVGQ